MKHLTQVQKRKAISMLRAGFGAEDIAVNLAEYYQHLDPVLVGAVATQFLPAVRSFIKRLRNMDALSTLVRG